MTYQDVCMAISAVAALTAIVSFIRTFLPSKTAKDAHRIASEALSLSRTATSTAAGQLELYINERITHTKERVSDVIITMTPLASRKSRSAEEQDHLEILNGVFNAAIENNLNAYEEACAKYLDNKVDKDRFKKTYKTEIRRLFENEHTKLKLQPPSSSFRAILKVYDEWENLEK